MHTKQKVLETRAAMAKVGKVIGLGAMIRITYINSQTADPVEGGSQYKLSFTMLVQ